jgi:D-glycero-D-manno-heptose 1,7-bisphosphate phosphatase
MILNAAEKYNIDLSKSYMVGDDNRDIQAAINANCIPVFLSNNNNTSSLDNIMSFTKLINFTEFLFK